MPPPPGEERSWTAGALAVLLLASSCALVWLGWRLGHELDWRRDAATFLLASASPIALGLLFGGASLLVLLGRAGLGKLLPEAAETAAGWLEGFLHPKRSVGSAAEVEAGALTVDRVALGMTAEEVESRLGPIRGRSGGTRTPGLEAIFETCRYGEVPQTLVTFVGGRVHTVAGWSLQAGGRDVVAGSPIGHVGALLGPAGMVRGRRGSRSFWDLPTRSGALRVYTARGTAQEFRLSVAEEGGK